MNFKITRPENKELRKVIDYFLFINSTDTACIQNYITYPNNNCCLALYKNNQVSWNQLENSCSITNDSQASISSRLYGWHNQPFKVSVTGELDQICILFKVTGLSQFTQKPLNQISLEDDPFSEIFGFDRLYFKQQLFEAKCTNRRTQLLETFLLQNRNPRPIQLIQSYIQYAGASITEQGNKIKDFCRENYISESTLFRSCIDKIGESPKDIKTKYRFRLFLRHLHTDVKLTELAYLLNYSDQSHLIKEVKKFTGLSPKKFASRVKQEENDFYVTY
ncbi:MAG: helix-turn-helix domain-containing protein [Saprospiraceae bacterium]|nr:helix-turn-helix domain-containing protein [Saprospiraceae bacterium]